MAELSNHEQIIWQAYPTWSQFTWLYLFSLIAGLRGGLFFVFELPGWEMWFVGAFLLLVSVAVIRRWAQYVVTPTKVVLRNGYSGREIGAITLEKIQGISIKQGPVASLFKIGTVVIQGEGDRRLRFRGIKDPEVVKMRIEALRPLRYEASGSA